MAQQEEPLYDFPEPSQPSERKLLAHQRGRGSLRSISVLDRLLLTVPVWLQLSINPATALHILRREPPGTFLVRKSRTSQRNVLCVRLADDSVPSFVQQFGIKQEHSSKTLTLETSAISFPDLPRLISFYCVSRDVLPFPLELPEAIAKATSHKELESISHMGIEFWSSHLNVRGPREPPKPRKVEEKKPGAVASAPPAAEPQTGSAPQPESAPQPNSDNKAPESEDVTKQSGPAPTLFHEFCPITTRSPRELDCGSGMGALCFINPLFLQSLNPLSRQRMFKRSLKIRVSTESSTLLSPPLAPPPPPPLMPKTKGRCKAQKGGQGPVQPSIGQFQAAQIDPAAEDAQPQPPTQIPDTASEAQVQPPSVTPHFLPEMQEQSQIQIKPGQSKARVQGEEGPAQLPTVMAQLANDSDYMQPCPVINSSLALSLCPYLSPIVSPTAPPLFPKVSPSLSPHDSPSASPSPSPYQSPSLSPRLPFPLCPQDSDYMTPSSVINASHSPSLSPYLYPSVSPMAPPLLPKASSSLSPRISPCASPFLSPYQSPSLSPTVPFSLSPHDSPSISPSHSPPPLSPYISPSFSQMTEQACYTHPSRPDQQRSESEAEEEEGAAADEDKDEDGETKEDLHKKSEEEERGLVVQMNGASLNDTESSSSFSSVGEAAETPPQLPDKQASGTSL